MNKIFKILSGIVIASVMALSFTACGTDGNNDNANNDDGSNNNVTATVKSFGLAEEVACIDIVTDDGQDITGDENYQPYKGCAVTVTNGREGENFDSKQAQVRVRGNNTAGYDKKSFRLKFSEKINLLGLNGGAKCKNWVLLACYKDVSFLRDAVTFEFAKQSLAENGYYASDYGFAEVNINGEYNGFYLVAEQQQVNSNRVNISEPENGYTGTDIGYLVEYDGNAYLEEPDVTFTVSYTSAPLTCEDGTNKVPSQFPISMPVWYTVKNDMYGSQQLNFIKNYTQNVFNIVYNAIYKGIYTTFNDDYTEVVPASYADACSTVEAVVNLDSWIDMFILQEIACDNDIDWSSFFFSVDMSENGDKKLTFQAPWDFDSGYGMMKGLEKLDKIFTANVCTNAQRGLNPWTALPASADWFMQKVAVRWNELNNRGVFSRLISLIDVVTQTYQPYFERNYERWDNLGKIVDEFQSDTVKEFTSQADASYYLENWLSHRFEFLDEYFNSLLITG